MYSDSKLSNAPSLHSTPCYTAYGPAHSSTLLLLLFPSSTPSIASLLHCIFHRFPLRQFGAEVVGGDWGRLQNEAARGENSLVLLPITFGQGKQSEIYSVLLFFLSPSAEVLLQCHGGRAAGFPQVPAPAQTQTPATRHGENGGGHQHAHLQRPQTARERDHGLTWESQSLSYPLCCREELCRDTVEKGQGKW